MGTPAELVELVLLFYRSPTPELDRRLREFQQSDEAWRTSVGLLAAPHGQVQAFAATTLKACAKRDANALAEEIRFGRIRELLHLVCSADAAVWGPWGVLPC